MMVIKNLLKSLARRKPLDYDLSKTKLNRCLSTLDLTTMGISCVLGVGVHILTGQVASLNAGPAVVLSLSIAAFACILSAFSYAEFGIRIPVAGSAYIYTYVIIGEFMAFVVGWNLLLVTIVGSASIARGYSGYVDSVFDDIIKKTLQEAMPITAMSMSSYPDFLALAITCIGTIILTIGVKTSSQLNKVFTAVNILVLNFVIVVGAVRCDIHNWKLDKTHDKIPPNAGEGGFFPYGYSGVMDGAAVCFFGFLGFDIMATAGEEVKNPKKAIPISIFVTFACVFSAYFGISVIQTLMVPYYLQNVPTPLPFVFDYVGLSFAKWFIMIGALIALSMSILGPLFTVTRILYSMGNDGIVFRIFGKVHSKMKTPVPATLFAGVFTGSMAMVFDVNELSKMVAISSLLAHTLMAICLLIVRYQSDNQVKLNSESQTIDDITDQRVNTLDISGNQDDHHSDLGFCQTFTILIGKSNICTLLQKSTNANGIEVPTKETAKMSYILITTICCLEITLIAAVSLGEQYLLAVNMTALTAVSIIMLLLLISASMLYRQPMTHTESFEVPLVPFIPILSIFVNLFFMSKLPISTWQQFGIWMVIGFCVYFSYGLWNSTQRHTIDNRPEDETETRF